MDMNNVQGFATPSDQAVTTSDEGIPRIAIDPVSKPDLEASPPPNKLQDSFLPRSDLDFDGDEEFERYELADEMRSIGLEPFPKLGADDRGVTLGNMSAGASDSSIGNDMSKGVFIGADKGASEMLDAAAFIAGAPVELAKDVMNFGLEAVGMEPVKNAFGDIESMKGMMDSYKGFVNDLIPMPDAIVDWASQPYDNQALGELTAAITQFGVAGFPAAKMVKAMTTYNPVARGFIWGAIADFTSLNPDDKTIVNAITEYLELAPPAERDAVLQGFMSQIEKYDSDSELVKRAKNAQDGMFIGAVVEGAIKAARLIPFGQIIDGTKRAIGRAGDAADARIAERAADNSVTLTAGADPMPAVDAAISAAGRAVRPASAEDVLRAKYPNVELDVSENAKGLILSKIAVPDGQRSSGVGSAVMSDLVSYADSKGLPLAVTPDSTFGGSKGRLEDFYKRFGFVRNKGKNKDFAFRETFVRQPKTDPNQVAGAAMDAAQARYFETGKFEPPTADNPVSIVPPTETEPGIIAFHGSGADFDEFRLEMIGTGEGAQAYGYGLYFTQSEDIAKFYRDGVAFAQTLRGRSKINYKGKPFEDLGDTAAAEAAPPSYNAIMSIASQMQRLTGSFSNLYSDPVRRAETAKLRVLKQLDQDIEKYTKASEVPGAEGIVIGPNGPTLENLLVQDLKQQKQAVLDIDANDIELQLGKIYKVGLAPKPDELVDYDLSLNQQSEKIKKALQPFYEKYGVANTADVGTLLESAKRTGAIPDDAFTEKLVEAGIPGIKYRAAGSRGATVDTADAEMNFVIFDDKMIKILEKYGIVGPMAVTAAGVKSSEDELIENEA